MWDVESAVQCAIANARPNSIGRCAQYTREAIEAGGLILEKSRSAKDSGPRLTAAGFQILENPVLVFEPGDVSIIENFADNPHGHMAIYTGTAWVSDFVQPALYPGPGYRQHKPPYRIFRYPMSLRSSLVGALGARRPIRTNIRLTDIVRSNVALY